MNDCELNSWLHKLMSLQAVLHCVARDLDTLRCDISEMMIAKAKKVKVNKGLNCH